MLSGYNKRGRDAISSLPEPSLLSSSSFGYQSACCQLSAMSCLSTLSSSSSSSSCSWASLPADLLELLVGSLKSFFDQLRFGAVCRSWRDATAALKGNPVPPCGGPSLPILTFRDPKDGGRGGQTEAPAAAPFITRCFYSLTDDKVYRLKAPHESRHWRCFGSSHGWLAMVDLCAKPFLFNPISSARVDLPSLVTLTRLIIAVKTRAKDGATVYIYRDPVVHASAALPGEDMRDYFIFRLVLSSSPLDSSCVVMATVSGNQFLAYTRPGDDSWVEVGTESRRFRDIIFHDRRFYAIGHGGETIAINFKDSKSPTHGRNCGDLQPIVEVLVPLPPTPQFWEDGLYLVALPSGEIIQVIRYVGKPKGGSAYETEAFEFYKLEVSSKGGEWVEIDSIGDCCLFLGFNHSMSLSAFQVLGKYRTNCIFFTDDNIAAYRAKDYGGLDFGIFDIEEETVEHFYHIDVQRVMPPPMWITPSL